MIRSVGSSRTRKALLHSSGGSKSSINGLEFREGVTVAQEVRITHQPVISRSKLRFHPNLNPREPVMLALLRAEANIELIEQVDSLREKLMKHCGKEMLWNRIGIPCVPWVQFERRQHLRQRIWRVPVQIPVPLQMADLFELTHRSSPE